MASMMLRLLTALNKRMIRIKMNETSTCTFSRIFFAFSASSFLMSNISTQKEVVSEAKAESALLNAAAIIPMVKKIRMGKPMIPEVQNKGRMSSPDAGSVMFIWADSVTNKMQRLRNRKVMGVKAML